MTPFPLKVASTWPASELVAMLRDDYPDLRQSFVGPVGPLPFWNVPRRNDYFSGREELLEVLEERLREDRAAAFTQAMVGLGGVGKTQAAIEYCHRHRSAYETGVYWADVPRPRRCWRRMPCSPSFWAWRRGRRRPTKRQRSSMAISPGGRVGFWSSTMPTIQMLSGRCCRPAQVAGFW